jgi:hypothetical protein
MWDFEGYKVVFETAKDLKIQLLAAGKFDCTAVVINPTLIDSRRSRSVTNVSGSDSARSPDRITLQPVSFAENASFRLPCARVSVPYE